MSDGVSGRHGDAPTLERWSVPNVVERERLPAKFQLTKRGPDRILSVVPVSVDDRTSMIHRLGIKDVSGVPFLLSFGTWMSAKVAG